MQGLPLGACDASRRRSGLRTSTMKLSFRFMVHLLPLATLALLLLLGLMLRAFAPVRARAMLMAIVLATGERGARGGLAWNWAIHSNSRQAAARVPGWWGT
jgi:hypothetical protein